MRAVSSSRGRAALSRQRASSATPRPDRNCHEMRQPPSTRSSSSWAAALPAAAPPSATLPIFLSRRPGPQSTPPCRPFLSTTKGHMLLFSLTQFLRGPPHPFPSGNSFSSFLCVGETAHLKTLLSPAVGSLASRAAALWLATARYVSIRLATALPARTLSRRSEP